ncbi:hypothetical protein BJY59DRAFT_695181 [Rhodotorula toruloides]
MLPDCYYSADPASPSPARLRALLADLFLLISRRRTGTNNPPSTATGALATLLEIHAVYRCPSCAERAVLAIQPTLFSSPSPPRRPLSNNTPHPSRPDPPHNNNKPSNTSHKPPTTPHNTCRSAPRRSPFDARITAPTSRAARTDRRRRPSWSCRGRDSRRERRGSGGEGSRGMCAASDEEEEVGSIALDGKRGRTPR